MTIPTTSAASAQMASRLVVNEYSHAESESDESLEIKRFFSGLHAKENSEKLTLEGALARPQSVSIPPYEVFQGNQHSTVSERVMDKNNMMVYTLTPTIESHAQNEQDSTKRRKVVLDIHGGGYVEGADAPHWNFLLKLIQIAPVTIVVPDYPLAPKHNVLDAMKCVEDLYRELVEQYGADNIVIMGDSAGAGLTLAFAQKLALGRKNNNGKGLPQPDHLILTSPFLDPEIGYKDIPSEINDNDPMLHKNALLVLGQLWAKDAVPVSSHLVSPINGPIRSVARRISVFAGTYDILTISARRLKTMLQEGSDVAVEPEDDILRVFDYFEYPKMVHVWFVFKTAEAHPAIEQMAELIMS